jgi:hypothetical protein
MALTKTVSAAVWFTGEQKNGTVYIFDETYSGAVTDQALAIPSDVLEKLGKYTQNIHVFCVGGNAGGSAVDVTIKSGSGSNRPQWFAKLAANQTLPMDERVLFVSGAAGSVTVTTSAALANMQLALWVV